jgi:hypothetical protein
LRKVAALVLSLASLMLGACSYLLQDPYAQFMEKAAGAADLGSSLGSGISYLGMTEASSGSTTYLFLEILASSGSKIVKALSASSLTLSGLSGQGSPSTLCAAVDAKGDYVVAGLAYAPSSLAADSLDAALPGFLASDAAAGLNYIFTSAAAASAQLSYSTYDASWASAAPFQKAFRSDLSSWRLARVLLLDDGSLALLAFQGSAAKGSLLAAVYPSLAAFAASTESALDASSASRSAVVNIDTNQAGIGSTEGLPAWPTSEGLVVLLSDANGGFRLARYGYDGGAEKDEYSVDSRPDAAFYFEPSGRYWFLYEKSANKLYKLRTWWTD